MMKGKPRDEVIIVLFHFPWDYSCDYVRQISLSLCALGRVIVYNPFSEYSIKDLIFDPTKRKQWLTPFHEKKVMYIPSVSVVPFQRFQVVKDVNIRINYLFFRVAYFLFFGLQRPIYWFFSYEAYAYLPFMNWARLRVYDRPDQWASIVPEEDRMLKIKDRMLLMHADYIFVNSPYSLTYVKRYNDSSYLLPWGCNAELFLNEKRIKPHENLTKIHGPKIGLVGHIDHRTNLKLLLALTKRNPQWNFIIVGSVTDFYPKQDILARVGYYLSELKKLPNFYFFEAVSKDYIPSYIQGLDICLVLYDTRQEFVKGCNPMKFYEYIAVSKPVISAPIVSLMKTHPTLLVAETVCEFENLILRILQKKIHLERNLLREIALRNSWGARIRRMVLI